ncbi:MAG TPA: hypothetical protein VKU60_02330, partial [Chloroflexota bacterium]|nr:hypothetical protein [Chloroflexota bacterium]
MLVIDDRLVDILDAVSTHGLQPPQTEGRLDTLAMLDHWDGWLPLLRTIAERGEPSASAAGARFLAPIRYPRKLLMAGANFTDHMAEMGGPPLNKETMQPYVFIKPPTTSIIGPREPVILPAQV